MTKSKQKTAGQVFTPAFIVSAMLDYCGYAGEGILRKHVMDNSCGDGAFLTETARRYIAAARVAGYTREELRDGLARHIHGLDNDRPAYEACRENLRALAARNGVGEVAWDVRCADALAVRDFDGRMDFVVGNPPYVRVHNLEASYDEVKRFKFANGGMTDLYLAFFELGFAMLSPAGKLCYITPGSWLSSVAAGNMRRYVRESRTLCELTDLGHFQPFDNATAYTLISLFDNARRSPSFTYYQYDGRRRSRRKVSELPLAETAAGSCLYLSDKDTLAALLRIKTARPPKYVSVKNGFATLADKVFIGDAVPDSPITIPVVKASTAKRTKCIFPYDRKGKPLPAASVFACPGIREHFLSHKAELLKGREEHGGWYLYGRSQALGDVYREKLSVNVLIRDKDDLKLVDLPPGEGIYSGLYIMVNQPVSLRKVRALLRTDDFARYVRALKKYKSGGYYNLQLQRCGAVCQLQNL